MPDKISCRDTGPRGDGVVHEEDRQCARCGCRLSRYNSQARCAACTRTVGDIQTSSAVRVPGRVWHDTRVREALAEWDFGRMLGLVRRLASLRQEDMAQITGLSQGALSMLESGTRRLTNIDKIIPVLDGLAVPPELVQLPLAYSADYARHSSAETQEAPEGSAPLVQGWETPLDIARRLNDTTASNTDPTTVVVLERTVEDIVARYEAEGPHQMAPSAVDLRGYVQQLLEGRQPPRQREALFRLAGQVSGLLGYMAVNAGYATLAEAYCTEAAQIAEAIDDRELLMWIFGTRSLNEYYVGRFDAAVAWADAGIDLDPRHPQAIRLLSNGRARALGKLGDTRGAEESIAAAEDLSAQHRLPDGLTSCISFAPYSLARTLANAATAHLALGNAQSVMAYAEQIDDLVEHSDSEWSRALVRLDVATAFLAEAHLDVEHAMQLGRQVLSAGGGPPIRSVVQRAGELQARARRWSAEPAVREYADAFQAWRASPQTRRLAQVCDDDGTPV